MKKVSTRFFRVLLFFAAVGAPAQAQVNLDQPVRVGFSDKVFRSAADPAVFYYIPIAINRLDEPTISELDHEHLLARFSMGVAPRYLSAIQKQLQASGIKMPVVKLLLPIEHAFTAGTDISERFAPELTSLGPVDLGGPTPYALRVAHLPHLFERSEGAKLLDRLFHTHQDNIGLLVYTFDAVVAGKPALVQTQIALFAGPLEKTAMFMQRLTPSEAAAGSSLRIVEDRQTGCWDRPEQGQLCVRR